MTAQPSKLASVNGEALFKEQLATIRSLLNATGRQKTFRTYQLLPRHRRRRIMSWSIRCIPRVFKKVVSQETLAPPPKPSRKARRRRLLCPLRVFFAKRFSICIRRGIRMPVRSHQKQLRYVERLLLTGAVCYCDLQRRYAIGSIPINIVYTRSDAPYPELLRLCQTRSSETLYLGGTVPVWVAYLNTGAQGTKREHRYLFSYNMLDEASVKQWLPTLQLLPNFTAVTFIARQGTNRSKVDVTVPSAVNRICTAIERRLWGLTEYCALRCGKDLTVESRLRSCYPNASSPELHSYDSSCCPLNHFVNDIGTKRFASATILRSHKVSKLVLGPLGEPPAWKKTSRTALQYKLQSASLELFSERMVNQLASEMKVYLSNDTIRKLRAMQISSNDTRKDPSELLWQKWNQEAVDEGEVIDDDDEGESVNQDSIAKQQKPAEEVSVKESLPMPIPTNLYHADICDPATFPLGCSNEKVPAISLQATSIIHPVCESTQFASLTIAIPREEMQPFLLGLVRDGIPIMGETELSITMCNLAHVPFIPTVLSPSCLYYNCTAVLDDFATWVKRPWTKRTQDYTSRSILWHIVQLLDGADIKAKYANSALANYFDFVLDTISQTLHKHYYADKKAAAKSAKNAFVQWITTPASQLAPCGFKPATARHSLHQKIDIDATVAKMKDFVECIPEKAPELEPVLRTISDRTSILCLSILHKYPYGHVLSIKLVSNPSAEPIHGIVFRSSYSSVLGRCLAIVVLVFTAQTRDSWDSAAIAPGSELHVEGEKFTSFVHWF